MSPLIAISLQITLLLRRKTMNCDKENKNICGLPKHYLRNLWHITVVLVHDMPAFHSPWHMQKNPSAAIQSLDVSTINNQRYQTHWGNNLGLRWLLVHIRRQRNGKAKWWQSTRPRQRELSSALMANQSSLSFYVWVTTYRPTFMVLWYNARF